MSENELNERDFQLTKEQMNQIQFLMECQRFEGLSRFIDQLIRYEYFRMEKFIKIDDYSIDRWDIELFETYDGFSLGRDDSKAFAET